MNNKTITLSTIFANKYACFIMINLIYLEKNFANIYYDIKIFFQISTESIAKVRHQKYKS
jgi:hypothetical protein